VRAQGGAAGEQRRAARLTTGSAAAVRLRVRAVAVRVRVGRVRARSGGARAYGGVRVRAGRRGRGQRPGGAARGVARTASRRAW
jgi:hypothetical protein